MGDLSRPSQPRLAQFLLQQLPACLTICQEAREGEGVSRSRWWHRGRVELNFAIVSLYKFHRLFKFCNLMSTGIYSSDIIVFYYSTNWRFRTGSVAPPPSHLVPRHACRRKCVFPPFNPLQQLQSCARGGGGKVYSRPTQRTRRTLSATERHYTGVGDKAPLLQYNPARGRHSETSRARKPERKKERSSTKEKAIWTENERAKELARARERKQEQASKRESEVYGSETHNVMVY